VRLAARLALAAGLVLSLVAAPNAGAVTIWHPVASVQEAWPGYVDLIADPLGDVFMRFQADPQQIEIRAPKGDFGSPNAPPTSGTTAGSRFGFDANGNAVFAGLITATNVGAAYRPAGFNTAVGGPQNLGPGTMPDVAMNDAGFSLTAFASGGHLKVFRRDAGAAKTFQPETLPTTTADGALVALDSDKSGVVVYSDGGAMKYLTRSSSGTWSGPAPLAPATAAGATFVHNAAGDAALLWSDTYHGAVKTQFRPHDGAFGASETAVAQPGTGYVQLESAAIQADGSVLLGNTRNTPGRKCDDTNYTSFTAELWRRPHAGGWSLLTTRDGLTPSVAASRTGAHVALAWAGYAACDVDQLEVVRALTGTVGTIGGSDTVMPGQRMMGGDTNRSPETAIDDLGNATVVWDSNQGTGHKLLAAAFDGGTSKPPPKPPPVDTLIEVDPLKKKVPVNTGGKGAQDVSIVVDCLPDHGPCKVGLGGEVTGSYSPASRLLFAAASKPKVKFAIKVKPVVVNLAAGAKKTAKLRISKKGMKKVRKALKAKGKVKLKVTVELNGRSGSPTFVTLKPKKK
jgi:hypothetical protein